MRKRTRDLWRLIKKKERLFGCSVSEDQSTRASKEFEYAKRAQTNSVKKVVPYEYTRHTTRRSFSAETSGNVDNDGNIVDAAVAATAAADDDDFASNADAANEIDTDADEDA